MRNFKIICAAAIVLAAASCTKNELGQAADTVRMLKTDLYTMKINGDAGFDRFIEMGGASSTDELSRYISSYLSAGPFGQLKCSLEPSGFACSALALKNPRHQPIAGRNFDWDDCKAMIIRSFPEHGYASISTANLDFLGFGEHYYPKGLINQFKATAAVYVPMDGINEKGLVVADLMAGDDEVTNQQASDRINLTTTTAIRLLLNKAADVDEAISMLENVNMHSEIGAAHHLFIADAAGRSVAVEWVDGVMKVTESVVLNNHYLCSEKSGIGSSDASWKHESKLLELREAAGGVMSGEKLADAMFSVLSLPDASYYGGTQWTVVYNMSEKTANYYWRRDRATVYGFIAGVDIDFVTQL